MYRRQPASTESFIITVQSARSMPDPSSKAQAAQELSERMSPISLETSESPEPAPPSTPEAAAPSHPEPQPAGWVFESLHILSIAQLFFMFLLTGYWAAALRWLMWDKHPIKAGRLTWMYEALSVAAAHVGVLFFAVASGIGIWIGSTWNRSKQNPDEFHTQVCFSASSWCTHSSLTVAYVARSLHCLSMSATIINSLSHIVCLQRVRGE
jgi:hypothetical protein